MKQFYVWVEQVKYGSVMVKAESEDEAKNYLQNKCKIIEPFRETYVGGKVIKVEDMNGKTKYYSSYWKEAKNDK